MIEEILRLIEKCPKEPNKLFLLMKIDDESGFFYMNGHVLFVVSEDGKKEEKIETEQLLLRTCVKIEGVANSNSFTPGIYSFIQFNGEITEDDSNLATFIKICNLYSTEKENSKISDFFFSIIDIFQLPKEQSLKNMVGLFGELMILKNIYEETGKNISYMWHNKSSDKYDFTDGEKIIEVKTTLSNLLEIMIKHQQLFGRKGIVIGVVQLEKANAGTSLKQLVDFIEAIPDFRNDLHFNLTLEKELRRISKSEMKNTYFNCMCVRYYKNTDIKTFDDIPLNISNLSYSYYLGDTQSIDIKRLII